MKKVKPVISALDLLITDRCNFRCEHCFYEDKRTNDCMSEEDVRLVLEKTYSPHLWLIRLFGGEPKTHPRFEGIVRTITDFLESKKVLFRPGEYEEHENMVLEGYAEKSQFVNIGIVTNGSTMLTSEEDFKGEIEYLTKLSITRIAISIDQPHKDYAKEKGLNLDYELLYLHRKLTGEVRITGSYEGAYILPVGAGRRLPWSRLIRPDSKYQDYNELREKLEEEYLEWNKTDSFSHICYCFIAGLLRRHEKIKKYGEENIFHEFAASIDPQLNFHLCFLRIPKPIGNLRDSGPEELYEKAVENEHYRTIAKEGPQGLARKLTDWNEAEIKERFLTRTPCGLCEDIYKEIQV